MVYTLEECSSLGGKWHKTKNWEKLHGEGVRCLFLAKKKPSSYYLMAKETNGQFNFVTLFFFSFVFHFTQSCPPNLNVVSEIKEKQGLYLTFLSQKTQKKKQTELLLQINWGEAKSWSSHFASARVAVSVRQRFCYFVFARTKKNLSFYVWFVSKCDDLVNSIVDVGKVELFVDANLGKQTKIVVESKKQKLLYFSLQMFVISEPQFRSLSKFGWFFNFTNTLKLVFYLFVWKQEVFSCNQKVLFCCHFCFQSQEGLTSQKAKTRCSLFVFVRVAVLVLKRAFFCWEKVPWVLNEQEKRSKNCVKNLVLSSPW